MSELISGKEALIALANGQEVEVRTQLVGKWVNLKDVPEYRIIDILENNHCDQFRLKPRTITINGIEVPAPFEPKFGEEYFYIQSCRNGYAKSRFNSKYCDQHLIALGAWRTEAEIKRVLEVLRGVLNVK